MMRSSGRSVWRRIEMLEMVLAKADGGISPTSSHEQRLQIPHSAIGGA